MGIARISIAVAVIYFATALVATAAAQSPPPPSFWNLYTNYTDLNHVRVAQDGQSLDLVLDRISAGAFGSHKTYFYGYLSMQIKLCPGNSAGTVTAYYASSGGAQHDEFDLEFLGNVSGQPYILQTNIFVAGVGNREVRNYLWFDPTVDYHSYSILWNSKMVAFYVDTMPIRVFLNHEAQGIPYPKNSVGLFSSLWDGSQWATEGGRIKLDWTQAPFIAHYRAFGSLDACEAVGTNTTHCQDPSYQPWWNGPQFQALSADQINLLKFVKQYYTTYDYCTDYARFPAGVPPECALLPY